MSHKTIMLLASVLFAFTVFGTPLSRSAPTTGNPSSCAVSPDGKSAAIGLGGGNAVILDAGALSEKPLATLAGHGKPVVAVAFSPDGRRVLTGSEDGTARTWRTRAGKPQRVLRGHAGPVRAVGYAADGRKALTGSDDGTARLWDVEKGKCLGRFVGHAGPVRAVAFLGKGRALTGSEDRTLRIWDRKTNKLISTIGVSGKVLDVKVSPDGLRAIVCMDRDQPEIWDLDEERRVSVLWGHAGAVTGAAWGNDGMLATGSTDGRVILWDPAKEHEVYSEVQAGPVEQVAHAGGARFLAVNRKKFEVVDPAGKLPPRIRTRAEKWALLIGSAMGIFGVPVLGLFWAGRAELRNRRGKKPGMPAPAKTFAQRLKIPALMLCVTLFSAALLVEIGLRAVVDANYKGQMKDLPPDPPRDLSRPVQYPEMVKFDPDPKIQFVLRPGMDVIFRDARVQINNLGFRDDPVTFQKPPRTLRVLGLGDSTMFGFGVARNERYLDLLEAEMNALLGPGWKVDFIDAAVPGYNTTQENEMLLKQGLRFGPDAVIVQFDKNDSQTIMTYAKPDFFFSRKLLMTRLGSVLAGEFSDIRAFYLLDQENLLDSPDYPYAGWTAIEKAYRDMARTCKERGIPLFGVMAFEDIGLMDDDLQPLSRRVVNLWQRIGITPVNSLPTAMAYLRETNQRWTTVTRTADDHHPNPIGHALIAKTILPHIHDALLARAGLKPEQLKNESAVGAIIQRQLAAGAAK
ncbi:MAG: GDSL-type esterase/lipase family protein [Candidatus Sumerlaeia bacterium]